MRVHLVRLRPRERRDEADPKAHDRASVAPWCARAESALADLLARNLLRRPLSRPRRYLYLAVMTEVTIKARANGPYKVEGPVRVIDAEGNEFVLPPGSGIVLCRCGHSQTKPFCDSSHKRVGFVAEDSAPRVSRGRTPRA